MVCRVTHNEKSVYKTTQTFEEKHLRTRKRTFCESRQATQQNDILIWPNRLHLAAAVSPLSPPPSSSSSSSSTRLTVAANRCGGNNHVSTTLTDTCLISMRSFFSRSFVYDFFPIVIDTQTQFRSIWKNKTDETWIGCFVCAIFFSLLLLFCSIYAHSRSFFSVSLLDLIFRWQRYKYRTLMNRQFIYFILLFSSTQNLLRSSSFSFHWFSWGCRSSHSIRVLVKRLEIILQFFRCWTNEKKKKWIFRRATNESDSGGRVWTWKAYFTAWKWNDRRKQEMRSLRGPN